MIEGQATLIIDLGNSQTRVMTQFGTNRMGKVISKLSFLDNAYGILPEDKVEVYLESGNYSDDTSAIFHFGEGQQVDTWCNGEICNTELTSVERPTALVKKYNSLVTKLTISNALRRGYEDVAEISDCDMANVGVSWRIVLLLPPEDIDVGSKQITSLAKGIKELDFLMPSLKKTILVDSVTVLPEGFCAYIAVLFDQKDSIRKGYAYLADPESITLMIDIGAGTTDFTLAKGGSIITSSRFTKEIGGNNVHRKVGKLLREKGIKISDASVRKGVETGVIRSGAKSYDIKKFIEVAKRDVSKQLVDAIKEYFEDTMFSVQDISNVLVCGGGAMTSPDGSIPPISDYITEFLRQLSPDIKQVDIPDDGDKKISPRLLNIIGAGIIAS